jgi:hypothetical protein
MPRYNDNPKINVEEKVEAERLSMAYNSDRKGVIDKLLMMLFGEWRRKLPEIFLIECVIARKLR